MEEPNSEELGEGWTEKQVEPEAIGSVRQSASQRRLGRWRSVEEYQEWRRLRRELDDLESF
ncbi:hypothetical protein CCP3SC15_320001 [Gammaproteobacteria bacterium]